MDDIFDLRYAAYEWILRLNRLYYKRFYTRDFNPDGIDVFSTDWDNLLILDACRHDALAKHVEELPGRLESRESRSSATIEFLEANVAGRDLTDTVYVTATPQYQYFADELDATFHAVVNLWADDQNMWEADDGRHGVLPETTTQHAVRVAARYPHKRLLVHYTQPHIPFLEPTTDSLCKDRNPYRDMAAGRLDATTADLERAYHANVERVIPHVRRLLQELEGRSVVTSDHGEMLGERASPVPIRVWGHPHGIYTEQLVRIPWLVCDQGDRRKTVAESPETDDDVDTDVVRDRLEHLGYRI